MLQEEEKSNCNKHVHFLPDTIFDNSISKSKHNQEKRVKNKKHSGNIKSSECRKIVTLLEEFQEGCARLNSSNLDRDEFYLEIKEFIKELRIQINALDEKTRNFFPNIINDLNSQLDALDKSTQSEPFILNFFGVYLTKSEVITTAVCCTAIASLIAYKKLCC